MSSSTPAAPTLLADLGGTNVRFALADPSLAMPLRLDSVRRYRVKDFPSLAGTIRQYFADSGLSARRAVIAAAGRIADGETVQITNNPWAVSAHGLQAELGMERVHLVNDFAAQGMAVPLLAADQLTPVGPKLLPQLGRKPAQTFVVVGPGTGLGVAGLLLREGRWTVLETEGGHAGFAAHTAEDVEILHRLNARFGRVSNERMICGNGLVNLYLALADIAGQPAEEYTPEDITARAVAGSDALCVRTVETLAGIFGSVAGDLVLSLGGWDGVYLTGGVLPILLPWLQHGGFRERFEAKGRFRETMEQVPTVAVMHPEPGLLGAAALAVLDAGATLLPPG
ncbi:glucokinase [Fulvimonas soli]|uniref:Glucokinase n=1 Tax=Fulvimonas soli TaxID=155197 RepID=A0A316I2T9_9GAMM|nr:glucokinase [Fulvimonas soli]PWK86834.1 glucokinase [Fulvimonas soli]TNY27206.1 glucokinase [Fulvimonas soli]